MKRTIRKKRIIQDVVDMKMRVNYVTDVGWAESWLFEGCCQLRRFVRHPCIHDHVAASLGEKDGCGPSPTACQQNIHVPSVFSHSASVRVRTVYYRSGRSQPQVRCSKPVSTNGAPSASPPSPMGRRHFLCRRDQADVV